MPNMNPGIQTLNEYFNNFFNSVRILLFVEVILLSPLQVCLEGMQIFSNTLVTLLEGLECVQMLTLGRRIIHDVLDHSSDESPICILLSLILRGLMRHEWLLNILKFLTNFIW